jgi:diaminohydroxyphosphoribosylaminopyrimidine deaminase/5-amino-6-(5-phosphoribosylamino)uracil reductase
MSLEEIMMRRCFQLAQKGLGNVAPNPMVGAVICQGKNIVGEGYHQKWGEAHAEVNAINCVENKELLKESTLYVNLEPCSHFGKTPPCADLIIKMGIPKVVISNLDPNPKVAGRGVQRLRDNGVEVIVDVLKSEGGFLNRRFFTFHAKKRPYIILKWAKTLDGYMDIYGQQENRKQNYWITNAELKQWVHKWRSEEMGIMIGAHTALNDNPELNVREWNGKNPVRVVLAKNVELPTNLKVFNEQAKTILFSTFSEKNHNQNVKSVILNHEDFTLFNVLKTLYEIEIQSVIVEGGKELLQSFVDLNIWDEARVLTGNVKFEKGLKAPMIDIEAASVCNVNNNVCEYFFNNNSL